MNRIRRVAKHLCFFLRTGHRDPLALMDSYFGKGKPKGSEVVTEAMIRKAVERLKEEP